MATSSKMVKLMAGDVTSIADNRFKTECEAKYILEKMSLSDRRKYIDKIAEPEKKEAFKAVVTLVFHVLKQNGGVYEYSFS